MLAVQFLARGSVISIGALLTAASSILRYLQNRGDLQAPNGLADPDSPRALAFRAFQRDRGESLRRFAIFAALQKQGGDWHAQLDLRDPGGPVFVGVIAFEKESPNVTVNVGFDQDDLW